MLLTRSPLGHPPEGGASLDLHVLSTPPAFVLSQDQTLRECLLTHLRPKYRSQSVDTESRRFTTASITGHTSWLIARCTKGIVRDHRLRDGRGRGYAYGTNFRHAVEFSRSGRTPARPFRAVRGNPRNATRSDPPGQTEEPHMAVRPSAPTLPIEQPLVAGLVPTGCRSIFGYERWTAVSAEISRSRADGVGTAGRQAGVRASGRQLRVRPRVCNRIASALADRQRPSRPGRPLAGRTPRPEPACRRPGPPRRRSAGAPRW